MPTTFDTPGATNLAVRIGAGRVELFSVDGHHTTVEVTPLTDDESSRTAAETTRVESRNDPSGSTVVVEQERSPGFRLFGREPQILVSIAAPHGAHAHLRVASADVASRGRFGSVRAKTASGAVELSQVSDADIWAASGDVRLGRVTGNAKLHTASGDIQVDRLEGSGKIRSASGEVAVGEALSDLKIHSASGDQRVDRVSSGRVMLQSASGDLTLGVARGSSVWVDAKSMSGEATSDLDFGHEPPRAGGPHVQVKATAMSGDVRIERAPSERSALSSTS